MENPSLPEAENARDHLRRLIVDEMDALSDLGALLEADPWPRPSVLALQVARCNRRRLRTIDGIEHCTGDSLQRVTPALLPSRGDLFRPSQSPAARNPEKKG